MESTTHTSLSMQKGAILSTCRTYRYALWRIWNADQPLVVFIGLNPSKADERQDDPTTRRCIGFACRWGFGGVKLVNLFAYRCSDPTDLRTNPDPIGIDNDYWIQKTISNSALNVVCWGNQGHYLGRDQIVLEYLPSPYCLRLTHKGQPAHPLFSPYTSEPIPFHPGTNSE